MLRVVLDTNIVVSGLLSPKGSPSAILDAAASKQFRCFVSEPLIEEYSEVLARNALGLDQRRVARFIRDFRKVVLLVVPRQKTLIARDPDDNMVMECAVEAKADFVVTGNTRDFPLNFRGIRVVTPRDFLVVLGSSPKPF
jgi:putative PIN family toxin of toxin-antitoxin system